MKKKKQVNEDGELVTKNFLAAALDVKLGKLKDELLEAFRGYRDEVLERMDRDAKELEQIREDQDFIKHDISDHETRLIKLETSSKVV